MTKFGAMQHRGRVQALLQQALALHQGGQIHAAESLCRQMIAIAPDHPDALYLLAGILLETGDARAALPHARRAAEVGPRRSDCLTILARTHVALEQFLPAKEAFERAAALDRDNPALEMGAASCLALLGEHAQAETRLRRLVKRRPALADAWFNLANCVRDQNRSEEAAALYRKALELRPDFVEACHSLGHMLALQGNNAEAERLYRRCIELRRGYFPAYANLARLLLDERRLDEIESVAAQALSINPNQPVVLAALGKVRAERGSWSDALRLHRQAVALAPKEPRAWNYLGEALRALGRNEEALQAFDTALSLDDSLTSVRFLKAWIWYSLGAMAEGAENYMHRATRQQIRDHHPATPLADELPERLDGKRVLLQGEQGLGDELFFLRYAARVKDRGAHVMFRGSSKLEILLRRSPLLDEVVPENDEAAPADWMVAVGDLPHLLYRPPASSLLHDRPGGAAQHGTSFRMDPLARSLRVFFPELPAPFPLAPLPDRVSALGKRLSALGPPPYIALTWRGGTPLEQQRGSLWYLHKQVPLQQLAEAMRGIQATFLAVQRGPRSGEIESLSASLGAPVHDLTGLNEDLEDMLALLALLDDYVGVSNTNMHLRAAAGKAARVLVPRPAEWRWMARGDESPWFPGFRVYRQGLDGSWETALGRLRGDLLAAFGGS